MADITEAQNKRDVCEVNIQFSALLYEFMKEGPRPLLSCCSDSPR